jgi:dihydroflavonol-4-reductase
MKVLVTGATGFLGSHLCRQMASAGFQVTASCRLSSNTDILKGLDLELRTADLSDRDSVSRAIEGHDVVVHVAANIRYAASVSELERVNVEGTRTVVRACRAQGIKRLVHVSSMSAIGIPPRGVIADERFPFNLESSGLAYNISKRRAEEAVLEEAARGLDAVVVNPTSIFGVHGQTFRGAEMILKVRQSVIVPYFGGGLCTVHIDDVVAGVMAALNRGRAGERYILGGENVTYEEVARRSALAMGLRRLFVPVWPVVTAAATRLSRFPYATHYTGGRLQFYSSAKAGQALGYTPRSFAAILQECLAFAACREPQTALPAPVG